MTPIFSRRGMNCKAAARELENKLGTFLIAA